MRNENGEMFVFCCVFFGCPHLHVLFFLLPPLQKKQMPRSNLEHQLDKYLNPPEADTSVNEAIDVYNMFFGAFGNTQTPRWWMVRI
jgi:hypothetical protein